MNKHTTKTYITKRKIVNFAKTICKGVNKVKTKFTTDLIYGIVKSESLMLSNIARELQENIKLDNTIERLSRNLNESLPENIENNYLEQIIPSLGNEPTILVDDSDVIKPYGKKFESLGVVRDGSSKDNKYEKGYIVTEMVGLLKNQKHPVSLFSHIHSSKEKNYKSTNKILYEGLSSVISKLTSKATFIFDRGYDMNSLFKYMHDEKQNYVVRITKKRKIFHKGKWYKSATLRDSRKGKIKTTVYFHDEGKRIEKEVYISYLNVKITADKENVKLLLVYGLGEEPMMLVTNRKITSKEDAIKILRMYLSRWKVEEYFRFKKQQYDFENFRVRSLKSINNVNKLLSYLIGFIGLISEKLYKDEYPHIIIKEAKALRDDIYLYYYQLATGMKNILKFARSGIGDWFKKRYTGPKQLMIKLAA